jgi:hypothetical protein
MRTAFGSEPPSDDFNQTSRPTWIAADSTDRRNTLVELLSR